MTVRLYVGSRLSDCPPFGCGRTASEVSEEEGSYTSHFYRWFLEELPFTSRDSARFNWHSCTVATKWRQRNLTQGNFLSTTSLAWSLALHSFCFSREKPLWWKEIHKHTHASSYHESTSSMHFSRLDDKVRKGEIRKLKRPVAFCQQFHNLLLLIAKPFRKISLNSEQNRRVGVSPLMKAEVAGLEFY